MYHAIQDISKNDVIHFLNGVVSPLRTQEQFQSATGTIQNAQKFIKKGELVEPLVSSHNPISIETNNIKKLSRTLANASGEDKKVICSLISKKATALQQVNNGNV